ncbi:MAG: FAD-binding and (Fe-S)-binding domain-containing protein [Actinomycetota bacterium]
MSVDYPALIRDLVGLIPPERLVRDPLRLLTWGTDASFYRLTPKVVAKVDSEAEVIGVLAACRRHRAPVTFRAAGTSLSGQAVTDSVLVVLGDGWNGSTIAADGAAIRLQPGVVGAVANRRLAPFARKIGPDPASIDTARIGGIAANNASGMCCGTADNSYQTLESLRVVLVDGTVLDTADAGSVAAFRRVHGGLLDGLAAMAARVRADAELAGTIRRKFAIKNTTGYSLNALVDFDDPVDILAHLMIGSEGTLGFISEIGYRTVVEHPCKASALLLFPDVAEACRAVQRLKGAAPVSAAELMDRAALRSVEDKPGMPEAIRGLGPDVAALLVETRAADAAGLAATPAAGPAALDGLALLHPPAFTDDPAEYGSLWKIRKGLFPAVGAVRRVGTTVIIEDVAFPIEHLAAATLELQAILARHGYAEAIIFGHALDGNLHFVFTQDFGHADEVARYARFMDEVCAMVAGRFGGSLKAEHGTGRNMAPFVELEWGAAATALMWEIKALFDPDGLLNPGVVLDRNPHAHLEHLKPLPAAHPLVDTCIECGFCEPQCPSAGLTLSPRQRIVGWREISRRMVAGEPHGDWLKAYGWQGLDTCAACGLCATACPVGIETGRLVKALRGNQAGAVARAVGAAAASHYGTVLALSRLGLKAASLAGGRIPGLRATLPGAAARPPGPGTAGEPVVYFPACSGRLMGPAAGDPQAEPLAAVTQRVLERAGFRVVLPAGLEGLCCGQPWDSKGLAEVAEAKAAELEEALLDASDGGRLPVVTDASTCAYRMKQTMAGRVSVLDLVEFLHDAVLPRLTLHPADTTVLAHVNCGARKQGLDGKLLAVVRACAARVVVPDEIGCCGFAGDKGFTTPELNVHALRRLGPQVPPGTEAGYASNRTCEIGLADHAGVPYRHVVYLVDKASR